MLTEQPLILSDKPMPREAVKLLEEGRSRFETVRCFDFVPCNYELACRALDALPRGRFCEWGSGFGIVTGLAEILGFEAYGIEIDTGLARASRHLLSDLGLSSPIEIGDYLTTRYEAEVYFTYCWPSRMNATQAQFDLVAPDGATLLICHGQSDIRCKVRTESRPGDDGLSMGEPYHMK